MGRGDKRTRRGKIFAGSYGKTRPKYKKKDVKPFFVSSFIMIQILVFPNLESYLMKETTV